ncbi:polysialyltransferase family glycosyltransferase [Anaerovibrio lipolyticus]|uniref:polysialyltransferase family glycosyltransferase n=1 Tax=Anaerovibrio lipolyticus TaxID=82374 RepID=UPI0025D0886B|nr:polysialyltransferase family glycosyltransferase [Anaerovibrio lipolyticus]
MRYLFICVTEFQLLSALNIKYHLLENDDVDIIIRNNHKNDDIINRIVKTNLFSHVWFFRHEKEGLHQYIRNITYHRDGVGLFKAFSNSVYMLKNRILEYIYGEEYLLFSNIEGDGAISEFKYDEVFFQSLDPLIRLLLKQVKKHNAACKWNLLDEGTMSYFGVEAENYIFDNVYLYEPALSVSYDDNDNFIRIPRIDRKDEKFINLINMVFDWHDIYGKELDKAVIFLDQGYQAMPAYLKNPNLLKKIIFANPYKKHRRLAYLYDAEIYWFKKVISWVGIKKYIKFHPRTWYSMKQEFNDNDIEILPNNAIPWEVICINMYVKNSIFITVNSSSACMYEAVIGRPEDNNYYILLDQLVQAKDGFEDGMFDRLLHLYPQKLFIPNTEEELRRIFNECLLKIAE